MLDLSEITTIVLWLPNMGFRSSLLEAEGSTEISVKNLRNVGVITQMAVMIKGD